MERGAPIFGRFDHTSPYGFYRSFCVRPSKRWLPRLLAPLDRTPSSTGVNGKLHQTTTSASALQRLPRLGTTTLPLPRPSPWHATGQNLLPRRSNRLPAAASCGCARTARSKRQGQCPHHPSSVASGTRPSSWGTLSEIIWGAWRDPCFSTSSRQCMAAAGLRQSVELALPMAALLSYTLPACIATARRAHARDACARPAS